MRLRLTRRAVRDLDAIANYIAARNPAASRQVRDSLQAALTLVSAYPRAGRSMERNVRRFVHPRLPYLIFYRIDDQDDMVSIISIRHAARQTPPEAS